MPFLTQTTNLSPMKILILMTLLVQSVFANEEITQIADLLPTTYYLAQEDKISCKGSYRDDVYDGTEKTKVKTPGGKVIATVCSRYYRFLTMEGSGLLSDRGQGKLTINWAGKFRFKIQKRCKMGHGISPKDCLLSHHTIAADPKIHKVGDIIYIPSAVGLQLPDGSTHNGYFIVLDTGGAFIGVGQQRVDLFVGLENDSNNVFRNAGFHHRSPIQAYKVTGQTWHDAFNGLKEKFGSLLSNRHKKRFKLESQN